MFVDASGNQKVISNNNGGETLFDAVYPMISWDLTSAMCETIKVIKDGKMSFMKSDGSYFANNLTFYVDAYVLSDEAWLVSDDGTNYRAVNMKGETISDGYVNVENQYGYDTLQVGEIKDKIIIHTENSLHILDTNGKCLYTLKFENYAFASQYDDNHIYITSENVFIAVNYDGTVAYEIKENLRSFSASTKNGYGIAYFAVADENGDTTERYEVVDLTTGKVLLETTSYPMINGDLIILNNESTGKTELKAIDGTVYIEDVYGLYFEIANRMGFSGYKKGSMTIGQGALIISLQSAGETSEAKTVILKKEDSFSLEEAIIINGYNSGNYYMDSMEFLFLYKDADSAMGPYYNMQYVYNVDGELIYDFTTDSEKSYSLWGSIYQDSVKRFDNESQTLSEVLCVVGVNDSQGQRIGYSILGKDGALSKVYTRINATTSGSYISAIDGDEVVVLDTNMDEVFRCKGDFIQVCSDKNNFIVSQEDTDYLYDANANLIYTGENTYIDANALSRYGSYCANEYDLSDYYDYCNLVLENGLCVVANVANDVSKFGVIKIGGTLDIKEDGLQYNESDGNWYYYVDGKVAVDYTGLVAHEGAWYYVASGVLNWGYTGLTCYGGTWYYVGNGILDWTFTGVVEYGGSLWYVENGIMICAA